MTILDDSSRKWWFWRFLKKVGFLGSWRHVRVRLVTPLHCWSAWIPGSEGVIPANSAEKCDSKCVCTGFCCNPAKVTKVVIYGDYLRAREDGGQNPRNPASSTLLQNIGDYRRGYPVAIQSSSILVLRARVVFPTTLRRTVTTLGRVAGQRCLTQAVGSL